MHCDACCGWDGESRYLETWSPARGTRSGREQSVLSRCTWPRWCSSPGDWPRGTEPVSEVLRDDESDSDCGWSCEDRCFSGETMEQVFYIDLELKKIVGVDSSQNNTWSWGSICETTIIKIKNFHSFRIFAKMNFLMKFMTLLDLSLSLVELDENESVGDVDEDVHEHAQENES